MHRKLSAVSACSSFFSSAAQRIFTEKMEIELMKKQINDSVQLSNEYADLRKWNHDIENHIMSVMYLMDMKNMRKPEHIPLLFCPGLIADHKKNNQRRIAVMKKNIKLIPLFLFLFVFQLLYFLSTIYTEKLIISFWSWQCLWSWSVFFYTACFLMC